MRKLFTVVLLFIAAASVFGQVNKEREIIDKVWNGIGGRAKWEETRYIRFTFSKEQDTLELDRREHIWDRYTGFYRIDFDQQDGKHQTILFNVNTKEGKAYIDTNELNDSISIKYLERAYSYFINDTYPLLLPAKLDDPGVIASALPDTVINSKNCYVLHLAFADGIGLTPRDQYWVFIDQANGHIIRWKFLLQDTEEPEEANWEPYINTGELQLSNEKTEINDKFSIKYPVIETSKSIDESLFKAPNGLD